MVGAMGGHLASSPTRPRRRLSCGKKQSPAARVLQVRPPAACRPSRAHPAPIPLLPPSHVLRLPAQALSAGAASRGWRQVASDIDPELVQRCGIPFPPSRARHPAAIPPSALPPSVSARAPCRRPTLGPLQARSRDLLGASRRSWAPWWPPRPGASTGVRLGGGRRVGGDRDRSPRVCTVRPAPARSALRVA